MEDLHMATIFFTISLLILIGALLLRFLAALMG